MIQQENTTYDRYSRSTEGSNDMFCMKVVSWSDLPIDVALDAQHQTCNALNKGWNIVNSYSLSLCNALPLGALNHQYFSDTLVVFLMIGW